MKKAKVLLFTVLSFLSFGTSCSKKEQVLIYAAAEDERIAYFQDAFKEKFPNYNVVIQYTGTGNLYTKLLGEGTHTDCDIFYDFEVTNALSLMKKSPDLYADLSSYDFSIYKDSLDPNNKMQKRTAVDSKTYGAILVNKKTLSDKSLPIPSSFDDLLDSKYKGLIEMPNPKSSGTGYSWYSGFATQKGKEEALSYFSKLSKNMNGFTSSGSVPTKDVNRGDVAIGFGMLWQAVEYANENSDLAVVDLGGGLPFDMYTMGMVKDYEKKEPVKEVFDYLFNTLNKVETCKFTPAPIYVNQGKSEIANYPEDIQEISMTNIFDPAYKQDLLDSWTL